MAAESLEVVVEVAGPQVDLAKDMVAEEAADGVVVVAAMVAEAKAVEAGVESLAAVADGHREVVAMVVKAAD